MECPVVLGLHPEQAIDCLQRAGLHVEVLRTTSPRNVLEQGAWRVIRQQQDGQNCRITTGIFPDRWNEEDE